MKALRNFRLKILLLLALLGLLAAPAPAQYVYQTIDDPVAVANSGDTSVTSISGNVVAGYFYGPVLHGFYHTLGTTNYTTLDDPVGFIRGSSGTQAFGISGNTIVGVYQDDVDDTGDYGFIYDIPTSNYMTLDDPMGVFDGSSSTEATGVDGTNIVGSLLSYALPYDEYQEAFLITPSGSDTYAQFFYPSPSEVRNEGPYNLTNYTTYFRGISGTNMAGYWLDENLAFHGFIYSIAAGYTAVTNPAGNTGAPVYGISGNTVVGYFADPNHGYNYSGYTQDLATGAYTTLREPQSAADTYALGVYNGTVVGYYLDASDVTHGFVATIPVPALAVRESGTNLIFTITNGIPDASFLILDTTNLSLPANQWPVLTSNIFAANGDFTFTNPIVLNHPPTFYQLSETP